MIYHVVSPLYFHFHRPPFNIVLLSSRHMPIPLQPPFMDFLCCDSNHFSFVILSFITLSSFRTSIVSFSFLRPPISFHVPSSMPLSLPHTPVRSYHCCVNFLSIFTFIFLSHSTPYTVFHLSHILCTLLVISTSSSPSFGNVDPRYVNDSLYCFFLQIDLCVLKFIAPHTCSLFLLCFSPRS